MVARNGSDFLLLLVTQMRPPNPHHALLNHHVLSSTAGLDR